MKIMIVAALLCGACFGQVSIPSGASLPGTCSPPAQFIVTGSPNVLYNCAATNIWIIQSGPATSVGGTLAGDVTGPLGANAVALVGGSTAANVHSAELEANAATNLNTASTGVKRDGSGNFTAGIITAALAGNSSTSTALAAAPTLCSTGSAPTGILASGNSTGCALIGGGATLPFLPVYATSTTYTLNSGCTLSVPCVYGIQGQIFSVTAPSTLTVSAGTDSVRVYEGSDGNIHADSPTATLACTAGCVTGTGAVFPLQDAFPVALLTVTSGVFSSTPADMRPFAHASNILGSAGLIVTPAAGSLTLSFDVPTAPFAALGAANVFSGSASLDMHAATGSAIDPSGVGASAPTCTGCRYYATDSLQEVIGNGTNARVQFDVSSVQTGFNKTFGSTAFPIIKLFHVQGASAAPVPSPCGTGPSVDANANDFGGTVTVGTTASSCTVTFNVPYGTVPHCNVTFPAGAPAAAAYTKASATLVVTATTLGGVVFDYTCSK